MARIDTKPQAGWLVGLMSGTSADGIDAALLWSDGERDLRQGPAICQPYDPEFRRRLMACFGGNGPTREVERELTLRHGQCVADLLKQAGRVPADIVAIGFHGQTVLHAPARGVTRQLADGALLARLTGIDVINDFRSDDIAHGGQGAPLVPVFHKAIAGDLSRPVAFLNIGGVANVTWIGKDEELLAFDTGPGNGLIDDWVLRHTGQSCDRNGGLAATGRARDDVVRAMLAHPYFAAGAPKSLDRDAFRALADASLDQLSVADGAATLTAFTAAAVARAAELLPAPPLVWIACGGGRRNPVLMAELTRRLTPPVRSIDEFGWDGDALEAMAFAYLAMRSIKGLALSFPGTTGVRAPPTGGRRHLAPRAVGA